MVGSPVRVGIGIGPRLARLGCHGGDATEAAPAAAAAAVPAAAPLPAPFFDDPLAAADAAPLPPAEARNTATAVPFATLAL